MIQKISKRLIETLEIQAMIPNLNDDIFLENMLSAWNSVPYPQLSLLLVHARYLSIVHQTHHWTALGDAFYGDHLLFDRLYNAVVAEIDVIAEKTVGLGCNNNVNLDLHVKQLCQLTQNYGSASTIPLSTELAKRSLAAEICFLRCIAYLTCSIEEQGTMTRGLSNMLQGIEDTHEGHVYLLKQRAKIEMILQHHLSCFLL